MSALVWEKKEPTIFAVAQACFSAQVRVRWKGVCGSGCGGRILCPNDMLWQLLMRRTRLKRMMTNVSARVFLSVKLQKCAIFTLDTLTIGSTILFGVRNPMVWLIDFFFSSFSCGESFILRSAQRNTCQMKKAGCIYAKELKRGFWWEEASVHSRMDWSNETANKKSPGGHWINIFFFFARRRVFLRPFQIEAKEKPFNSRWDIFGFSTKKKGRRRKKTLHCNFHAIFASLSCHT